MKKALLTLAILACTSQVSAAQYSIGIAKIDHYSSKDQLDFNETNLYAQVQSGHVVGRLFQNSFGDIAPNLAYERSLNLGLVAISGEVGVAYYSNNVVNVINGKTDTFTVKNSKGFIPTVNLGLTKLISRNTDIKAMINPVYAGIAFQYNF
jgi:hypothetical protein